MTELWDWIDGLGWEALAIWAVAAVAVGLLDGAVAHFGNPTDERPEPR